MQQSATENTVLHLQCHAQHRDKDPFHRGRAEAETLGTIDTTTGQGWCELAYDLPEKYTDNGWNVISFDVNCEHAGQVFVIGEAHIYESKAHDLAVTSYRHACIRAARRGSGIQGIRGKPWLSRSGGSGIEGRTARIRQTDA